MIEPRRRVDLAALAAHLAEKIDDPASRALRRNRRNGHSADCPNWRRPVDLCGVCRAEVNGRTTEGAGDEPDDR